MWLYQPTGASIREGKAWTDVDGIQHPANWYVWSLERKTEMGLTEIIYEAPPDSRLYHWGQNPDGTITKTAKDLDECKSETGAALLPMWMRESPVAECMYKKGWK
jgi:hypothetical protein